MCTPSALGQATESRIGSVGALFDYLEKEHGYVLAAPVDVDKIAEWLGIEVDESIDESKPGTIGHIQLTGSGPKVWINPRKNAYSARRRFTLAHEIAHFCLHLSHSRKAFVDTRANMGRSESYWNIEESEANSFAAELLMPKKLIISEGNKIVEGVNNFV
ncbi:MAG: ImmA/IrrE family metallo-endopeptidase [Massilia sp.]